MREIKIYIYILFCLIKTSLLLKLPLKFWASEVCLAGHLFNINSSNDIVVKRRTWNNTKPSVKAGVKQSATLNFSFHFSNSLQWLLDIMADYTDVTIYIYIYLFIYFRTTSEIYMYICISRSNNSQLFVNVATFQFQWLRNIQY